MTVLRPLLLAAVSAVACSQREVPHPDHEEPVRTNRIAVPASVRQNLGVGFVGVERRRIAQTLRCAGHFELLATARSELRTPLSGRVTVLVAPLQAVRVGDVVCRLDAPDWRQAQRDLGEIETQVRVDEAKRSAMGPLVVAHEAHEQSLREAVAVLEARQRGIQETQTNVGGMARELAEVQAQLAQVRADLAEAREKGAATTAAMVELDARIVAGRERFLLAIAGAAAVTGLSGEQLLADVPGSGDKLPRWRVLSAIEVRASGDGLVDHVQVGSGGWVEAGQLIATVSDLSQVRFRAQGMQSDLPRLCDGLQARAVPAIGAGVAVGQVSGTLLLGADADPAQRTLDLFLVATESASWARPGVAGFLEIETAGAADPVLAIPLAATLQDGLERVLFRRDPKDPDQVIRVQADLGLDDGRWVEVRSGLRDGDSVVLTGAYELMLASSGTAAKGGHFHADGTFHAAEDK